MDVAGASHCHFPPVLGPISHLPLTREVGWKWQGPSFTSNLRLAAFSEEGLPTLLNRANPYYTITCLPVTHDPCHMTCRCQTLAKCVTFLNFFPVDGFPTDVRHVATMGYYCRIDIHIEILMVCLSQTHVSVRLDS